MLGETGDDAFRGAAAGQPIGVEGATGVQSVDFGNLSIDQVQPRGADASSKEGGREQRDRAGLAGRDVAAFGVTTELEVVSPLPLCAPPQVAADDVSVQPQHALLALCRAGQVLLNDHVAIAPIRGD